MLAGSLEGQCASLLLGGRTTCLGAMSGLCPYTLNAKDEDRQPGQYIAIWRKDLERKVNYFLLLGKYCRLSNLPFFNACRTWKSFFLVLHDGGPQPCTRSDDIPLLDPKTRTRGDRDLVCGSWEPQLISCHTERYHLQHCPRSLSSWLLNL